MRYLYTMNKQEIMKKQAGMSLVEVMVAITISLILLAGIGQIYMSNKQTYRTTDAMSRLQENGRFAMDFISQSVRNSDHWGCLGRFSNVSDPDPVISADVDGDGTDETVANFSAGLSSMNDLAVAGLLLPSDTIRLISASQDGMSVSSALAGAATIVVDNAAEFSVGDDILINDCENAEIATITGINLGTDTLTISNNLLREYIDATVHTLVVTTYSLSVNAAGNPALDLNGAELVEGVENMQVLYGEDTDGDRVANYYVAPGTIVNMNNVVSAKLTLTVRTLDDNIALRPRDINNDGVDDDSRIAKNYTATLAIRNRLN